MEFWARLGDTLMFLSNVYLWGSVACVVGYAIYLYGQAMKEGNIDAILTTILVIIVGAGFGIYYQWGEEAITSVFHTIVFIIFGCIGLLLFAGFCSKVKEGVKELTAVQWSRYSWYFIGCLSPVLFVLLLVWLC